MFLPSQNPLVMAKERITIIPHSTGNGFEIPFPNGTITVPDTPGGYCISSGCGSGKTESIKSLIRQKHSQGVLYCVDTVSECQKMYQWVHDELVTPGILTDKDVMMINSKADIESMKTYQDHPEKICDVQILIVVHVRFFVELINYFMLYKPSTKPMPFDGDFRVLMARSDLRKYIIFDETPLFLKPFVTLTKGQLSPYVTERGGKWVCMSPQEIRNIYDSFIKGDPRMDYYRKDNVLGRTMNSVVLSMIPRLFDTWMSQLGKECNIQFWPSDLVQPTMSSHILVYEGAGDVLLGSSSKFKLLDVTKKYNSKVVFHPFTFNLDRKKEPDTIEYTNFVSSIVNIIRSSSGKTLIVIWKDFKASPLTAVPDDTYTSRLKETLVALGIPDSDFTVTYYGASDTKSTNSYRDYTNIILAGRWGLTPSVITKLKQAFNCQQTCMENYMMWYYVQLLLRIGIRNNNYGTYHVYYSSDHKDTFIDRLSIYLNFNILIPTSIPANTPLWEIMVKRFKKGSYYLKDIRKLSQFDPGLKNAIETGQPYTMTITLKDIGTLIPKKKKLQKDNYKSLVSFLRKLLVILVIKR